MVTISLETEIGGLGQHQSSLSDLKLAVFQKVDPTSLSVGDRTHKMTSNIDRIYWRHLLCFIIDAFEVFAVDFATVNHARQASTSFNLRTGICNRSMGPLGSSDASVPMSASQGLAVVERPML